MSRPGSALVRWPWLPVAVVLAACAAEPGAPVLDLAAELELATVTVETATLAIGDDRSRPHLAGGWSGGEIDPGPGRSFRWGVGEASELLFHVVEPRPIELVLEGRPRPAPAGARPAVEVAVNGEAAGRIELGPELAEHRLAVPAGLLFRGLNRLTLGYEIGERPPIAGESRDLAVAWYRVGLAGLGEPGGPPRAGAEGDTLFIPWGTRIDYHLRLPAGAALEGRLRRLAGGGRLAVHLETDGAPPRRLASFGEPGELALPLAAEAGTPARLSLAAVGAGGEGGLALERPLVVAPATPEAPAAAAARGGEGEAVDAGGQPQQRPNVVVYLVDTLRADRLGCYGGPRPVSPAIDRFAARATLFENARAQSSWTLSAVASIFTGLWPPAHGVLEPEHRLAEGAVTLAEHLRAAGWATSAIVTNGLVAEAHGTAQGFDDYLLLEHGDNRSRRLLEETVAWLDRRDRGRPFFLYLHSLDPHTPYLPDDEFRRRHAAGAERMYRSIVAEPRVERWPPTAENVDQLLALYDAEIAENDAAFGATLDILEQHGLFDDALVVFLSDHGEEFFEHGSWNHGVNLHRETIDMPLIVKLPRQREGRRVGELVQQIDLLPSLLDLLGLPAAPVEGRSLAPLLGGRPAAPAPPAFAHVERRARAWGGVIEGEWKYVLPLGGEGPGRLYHWRRDPAERADRAAELPVLAGLMRTVLERRLRRPSPLAAEPAVLDRAAEDNLRALGYID